MQRIKLACLVVGLLTAIAFNPARAAAPTLDASGFFTATFSSASSSSISVSTTSSNDILVLLVVATLDPGSTIPTVSTVEGCNSSGSGCSGSLVWKQRSRNTFVSAASQCFGSNTCAQAMEVWWAFSSGTQSSHSVAVVYGATVSFGALQITGVNGAADTSNPWDRNLGLPSFTKNQSSSASGVLSAPFSTTNPNDLLLSFFGYGNYSVSGSAICTGWSGQPLHHTNVDDSFIASKAVTAVQSSATVSENGASAGHSCASSANSNEPWQITVDALSAAPLNTTWNPSDKDSAVTLGTWSGQSNLYAEQSSASASYRMVRSTTGQSTGKFYFEVIVTAIDSGNQGNLIGVANGSQALANFVGSTNDSLGFKSGTAFKNGGGLGGSPCSFASVTTVIGLAVDLTNNKIWCTTDGSIWSNCSACATGDPTSAATGYDIASVNTGSVFIAWSGQDNASADSVILNVGNYGPFQFSIPSGYGGWDSSGTTLTNLSGTGTFIAAASGAYDSSGSNATLSNSNKTAASASGTKGAVGDWNDIKLTGKRYFEVTWDAVGSGVVQDIGIASPVLPGTISAGTDAYGWSYVFAGDANGYTKNAISYSVSTHKCTPTNGLTAGIAVDFTNNKMWCTPDGTNYTNGDSPSSGTGGMSLVSAHLGYGTVVAVAMGTSGQFTINLGASAFSYACPTGFVGWDGSGCSGATAGAGLMFKSGPGW